ncbi:MAG: cytochrome P450 [Betaproteobacteria bacterium]|nr:cytochrome P450 [Betaproteobacteria bacterium]
MSALNDLNLLDPGFAACPYQAYATLLKEAPVFRMPQNGAYVVSRYDLVMEAVKNTKLFSNRIPNHETSTHGGSNAVAELYAKAGYRRWNPLLGTDPPDHTYYRSLVDRFFTAGRCRDMRPKIEGIAGELVDEIAVRGEAEFVGDFALKLPVYIIADMLGVPRSDIHLFREWSEASLPTGMNVGLDVELSNAARVIEFFLYMDKMILDRRKHPGDDILSSLALGRDKNGEFLEMSGLLGILLEILVAGNETVKDTLATGMIRMIDDPAIVESLRTCDERTLRVFADELVRLECPVQGTYRWVTQDTELGGVKLVKGAMVNLRWAAANRDPAEFPDPERLDPTRRNPGAHVGFGIGEHYCLGASLAREELQAGLRALATGLNGFRYAAPDAKQEYLPNFIVRSLRALPIRFERRR